jgi:hypothetical protein
MILMNRPGRSRLLWALLLSAALVGATVFGLDRSSSSAQQASDTTVASTDSTDTTAASDSTDTTQASDSTDTTVAGDDTTTTAAGDETTTTAAGDGNGINANDKNFPVHDGTQKGNVFNETPYGEIPASDPQIFIERPGSGRILPLNTEIQVRARIQAFQPGFFNDPATQYGLGPQRLNAGGDLQGHNHACAQLIPRNGVMSDRCDSFVVLEQEGTSNIVSNVLPPLTKAGRYRICTDVAAGNHYVAARGFAQRGGPVDCVRVLVVPMRGRR